MGFPPLTDFPGNQPGLLREDWKEKRIIETELTQLDDSGLNWSKDGMRNATRPGLTKVSIY